MFLKKHENFPKIHHYISDNEELAFLYLCDMKDIMGDIIETNAKDIISEDQFPAFNFITNMLTIAAESHNVFQDMHISWKNIQDMPYFNAFTMHLRI